MDEARSLLIAACGSLARLQIRLIDQTYSRRKAPNGAWIMSDPDWRVEELDPPSPWLDACAPRVGITSVISAISLVQVHLLAMIEAEGAIDGLRPCVILHYLSLHGTSWSSPIQRLAQRLGVDLPANVWDATHGASLHHAPYSNRLGRRSI